MKSHSNLPFYKIHLNYKRTLGETSNLLTQRCSRKHQSVYFVHWKDGQFLPCLV
jgi:hypothetical protein